MDSHVLEILRSQRFALVGFDADESASIITALREVGAFGNIVDGKSSIPGLNIYAPFSGCLINMTSLSNENQPAASELIAHSRKPSIAIGSPDDLERMPPIADPRHDFLVRPYPLQELIVRAYRVLRIDASPGRSVSRCALIADDDETTRILISTLLRHFGFQCHIARNGAEALRLARELTPALALIDLGMPEIDGFSVVSSLRNDPLTAAIGIIIITGRNNEEAIVKGFALGADDYITKPLVSGEVMARVSRVMRDREVPEQA